MKKAEMQGIVNDLLDYRGYENPLRHATTKKIILNLLNREIRGDAERSSIWDFLKEKYRWFQDRIKNIKTDKDSIEEAKIIFHGNTEKIKVIYKGTTFENSRVH